jgi:hypothetical protein
VVKKMCESKPEGRRRTGRPRVRWLEDVERDLRELRLKRWRQKAVDRGEGASTSSQKAVEPWNK